MSEELEVEVEFEYNDVFKGEMKDIWNDEELQRITECENIATWQYNPTPAVETPAYSAHLAKETYFDAQSCRLINYFIVNKATGRVEGTANGFIQVRSYITQWDEVVGAVAAEEALTDLANEYVGQDNKSVEGDDEPVH